MTELTEVVSGLRFPEGPIAFPDGSFTVVEMERKTLSRITASGKIEVIAELGGCPNGAALGPDGMIYICNNGGLEFFRSGDRILSHGHAPEYSGGWIEKVDPVAGAHEILYRSCDERQLLGPNDIVFDRYGGFYFTDSGKTISRRRELAGVYYALPDGSSIKEVVFPVDLANGIGLSADESILYVSETMTGRLWAFELAAPGEIKQTSDTSMISWFPGRLVAGLPGLQLFDSLALDEEDHICIATLMKGGITSISPDGKTIDHFPTPDFLTTNICFGGHHMTDAYITLSSLGKLVKMRWPRPGLKLNYLNK
jgi:gluconolactonase